MLTLYKTDLGGESPLFGAIARCVADKTPSVLLVPEQQTVLAEAALARLLPSEAPLFFEASNFTRLANTAFRKRGGLSYRYANDATAALLMWKVVDALAPTLHNPPDKRAKISTVKQLCGAEKEMGALGVTPTDLHRAAEALPEGEQLRRRTEDLSAILALYRAELHYAYGSTAEDLDSLAALLSEEPLFGDTLFFVDGFTSFTRQQLRILKELLRHSSIAVFLPLPETANRQNCFLEVSETERALCALAEEVGQEVRRIALPKRRDAAFAYAEEQLFRADRGLIPNKNANGGFFRFTVADDPFAAADTLAAEIKARVAEGARYRDFSIVAGNADTYLGILDRALEKYGIPVFTSARTDLAAFELIKMISSAYAAVCYGFQRADVITYMKCRFGGISQRDADLFELYTERFSIHGKLFTQKEDFTMNPLGYTADVTEESKATLAAVNGVKRTLLSPLLAFRDSIKGEKTAKEHAEALYGLLESQDAERQMLRRAEKARVLGREAEAKVLLRLFPTVCELLDTVVEVMEDTRLTAEQFAEILTLLFGTVNLGQIPVSEDAVLFGSAATLRAEPSRFVMLFGVNEGEFPATVHDSGFFTQADRQRLEALSLPVSMDLRQLASREEFCFLRALSLGRENAFLYTFRTDAAGSPLSPAPAYRRLLSLFEAKEADASLLPLEALIYTRRVADEYRNAAKGSTLADAIARATGEPALPYMRLSDGDCVISPELASTLFPPVLRLTQSRIDAYVNCPFSYYGSYILRLNENSRVTLDHLSVGNLIHALLEIFLTLVKEEGLVIGQIPKEQLSSLVNRAAESYMQSVYPQNELSTPRLRHLLLRLQKSARLMAEELNEEFAHSDFTPVFMELSIGDENAPSPLAFTTPEGRTVSLYGKIDRVDMYRSDDGKVYLRVIDYKTGNKKFSIKRVESGRDVQLPLYLFALWKSRDPAFLEALGITENDEVLPAGAFYMLTSPKDLELDAPEDAEAVRLRVRESIGRNGLILRDEAVLRAMDNSEGHRYDARKPSPRRKGEAFGENALSLPEMGALVERLEAAVAGVGSRMCSGDASARPASAKEAGHIPCEGCALRPFCRSARQR